MQKVTVCGIQEVLKRRKEYLSHLPKENIKKEKKTHSNVKKSIQNINSLALQIRKKYYKQMISLGRTLNLVQI
jgi:hypothetical protein